MGVVQFDAGLIKELPEICEDVVKFLREQHGAIFLEANYLPSGNLVIYCEGDGIPEGLKPFDIHVLTVVPGVLIIKISDQ